MRAYLAFALIMFTFGAAAVRADDDNPADTKSPLEGVWQGIEIIANGQKAPQEAADNMRFTFKGKELLVRGNREGDMADEKSTFEFDDEQSPKHFSFMPEGARKQLQGIYKIEGDVLTLCVRHDSSDKGRPTEFASEPDTDLILVKLKRQ